MLFIQRCHAQPREGCTFLNLSGKVKTKGNEFLCHATFLSSQHSDLCSWTFCITVAGLLGCFLGFYAFAVTFSTCILGHMIYRFWSSTVLPFEVIWKTVPLKSPTGPLLMSCRLNVEGQLTITYACSFVRRTHHHHDTINLGVNKGFFHLSRDKIW